MDTWQYEVSTFITNWSEELMKFSIPTLFFPLTDQERDQFSELIFAEKLTEEQVLQLEHFKEKIAPAFQVFPGGVFLRNDRRSPKDSEAFIDGVRPAQNPQEALGIMYWSERTWADFREAKTHNHLPTLVARQWVEMKSEREFRCFVVKGRLFAISQYDYWNKHEWVHENASEIPTRISAFFEQIQPLLPHQTIVFDVHVNDEDITLIETNPYGLSDPCLFQEYGKLEKLYAETDSITCLINR